MQVNARVPDSVPAGLQSVQITAGTATSQPGVVIAIAGAAQQAGAGPEIDARLAQLRRERATAPLPEIASDRDPIPTDWLGVVSWNIQVGGTSPTSGAARPPMVQAALRSMFAGTYQLLAAQEISNSDTAEYLRSMLPSGATWKSAFIDSTDSMDNGFWYRDTVFMRESFLLLTTDRQDSSGRVIADEARALHPPHVAQFEIGDFDFTMITLHLTFADGDTSESIREFKLVLDYLDWYFRQPDHDPDVVICGDFNTPSVLSGETGRSGLTLDEVFDRDPRFQAGERRFAITVHEPTSRSSAGNGGIPARNYDHCVISADTLEEFVQARRVTTTVLTDHPDDPEVRLTSDHFPTVAFFKTRGPGISLDLQKRIRPN
jgi:endonuclease/exonuclease/phosphatase family metal-dependent hydrolase